jgi:hypothetical protein
MISCSRPRASCFAAEELRPEATSGKDAFGKKETKTVQLECSSACVREHAAKTHEIMSKLDVVVNLLVRINRSNGFRRDGGARARDRTDTDRGDTAAAANDASEQDENTHELVLRPGDRYCQNCGKKGHYRNSCRNPFNPERLRKLNMKRVHGRRASSATMRAMQYLTENSVNTPHDEQGHNYEGSCHSDIPLLPPELSLLSSTSLEFDDAMQAFPAPL